MAEALAVDRSIPPPPPPPTSPPAVYSQSAPPVTNPLPPLSLQESSRENVAKSLPQVVARKPLPLPPMNVDTATIMHVSPLAVVRINQASNAPQLQASSAQIEENWSILSQSPAQSRSASSNTEQEMPPPQQASNRLSPAPQLRSASGTMEQPASPQIQASSRLSSASQSRSASGNREQQEEPPHQEPNKLSPALQSLPIRPQLTDSPQAHHRRGSSLTPDQNVRNLEAYSQNGMVSKSRHSSSGSTNSTQPEESFQPLQYHHQPFQENNGVRKVENRASKGTIRSSLSDSSSTGDRQTGSNQHLAPMRNSFAGPSIPRPISAYSSASDLNTRGRTRSPQLSPNQYARAPSAHSTTSPDTRPLSYVDLLNVPYPQPPPAPANFADNAHLQRAVGNNASLLSTKKTLEMYRANVKKTNDPAIQYEFAVFMISAAQEAGLEEISSNIPSSRSDSNFSDKSGSGTSQAELLREARQILQRLSDRSYPFAQYYLADGYASGLFNKGKEDNDKAFPLFVSASKHGHAEAGYRTALCYEFGWGCRTDAAKAVQFYRHAASKNHPGAMSRLGRACLVGDMGLGKRYREGLKWLKRAADSADFQYNAAPYELGVLHETGYGDNIFADESYAAQLFTKSADLGHPEANYRLGDAYEHGKLSCPRDPALSVHFYTGAAQQGHPLAMMALCAWYMVGAEPVLEKDENEAYEWARKAAECGLAKAEYAVGYFTEMGIGCRRDLLEANVWYVRAADQGDEKAKHRIAAIRAAASGANPVTSAEGKLKGSDGAGNGGDADKRGKKRFGIF